MPNQGRYVKDKSEMSNRCIMIVGLFEAAMLVCFAASWPFNLVKAYHARTNVGTSILFMLIILMGYLFGVANKIVSDDINYVLCFYILDIFLVSAGVLIYIRNRFIDSNNEA